MSPANIIVRPSNSNRVIFKYGPIRPEYKKYEADKCKDSELSTCPIPFHMVEEDNLVSAISSTSSRLSNNELSKGVMTLSEDIVNRFKKNEERIVMLDNQSKRNMLSLKCIDTSTMNQKHKNEILFTNLSYTIERDMKDFRTMSDLLDKTLKDVVTNVNFIENRVHMLELMRIDDGNIVKLIKGATCLLIPVICFFLGGGVFTRMFNEVYGKKGNIYY
jgi:hypothetical protein